VIYLTDADCLLADDPFERTILPLICDGEDAATGRYAPLSEQRNNPFVLQQWWVESYARERSARYVEGLIGRNAAVRRDVLEAVGGFGGEIPIGTDYYLAHRLVSDGRRIRYVHDSMIETRFHRSAKPYLQQQSRWLRNVLWHGPRMRAHRQFYSALLQCLIGLGFWTLILAWPIIGATAFLSWSLLLVHGTVARLRYIAFGAARAGEPLSGQILLESPLYFMLDQVAAAYALLDWMRPSHRKQW
jgi:cellulose synthase/poly-beta-1,6-N-acetylglucosamine synthase-like glycosyltransferase